MEYSNFDPNKNDLSQEDMSQIKEWVQKYEKYYNFHNNKTLESSIKELANDASERLNIDESKRDDVEAYLENLCTLSEGLSVVMAPDMQFIYNGEDQVQKFRY